MGAGTDAGRDQARTCADARRHRNRPVAITVTAPVLPYAVV